MASCSVGQQLLFITLVVSSVLLYVSHNQQQLYNFGTAYRWRSRVSPLHYYYLNASRPRLGTGERPEQPITHFIYHALHKTASTSTRHLLYRLCQKYGLSCLSYEACAFQLSVRRCFVSLSLLHEREQSISYGTFTVNRLQRCCPANLFNEQQDGVVAHLSLELSSARAYLSSFVRADAVRFTIVRQPVAQFISYWTYIQDELRLTKSIDYLQNELPSFNETVELFYEMHLAWEMGSSWLEAREPATHSQRTLYNMYKLLTNSQSKELGWDAKSLDTLPVVLAYVDEELDFVGLVEQMDRTWQLMADRFGWQTIISVKRDRNMTTPRGSSSSQQGVPSRRARPDSKPVPTPEQVDKIRRIQCADLQLYDVAEQAFSRFSNQHR